jgi:transposase-like protein
MKDVIEKQAVRKERTKPLVCPRCGGTKFIKRGTDRKSGGGVQRYQCKNKQCGKIEMGEWIEEPQEKTAVNLKK